MNTANNFKDERRPSSCLSVVKVFGTSCMCGDYLGVKKVNFLISIEEVEQDT